MFMSTPQLLFRVTASGHEYRIYTNGRVEGFGNDVQVVNHIPRLCSGLLEGVLDSGCLVVGTAPRHSPQECLPQSEMLQV